jgi:hypothetical protein
MKTTIKAELVAHSKNEQGDELISVLATFPRIILAEVNTHRMLSKNTSSSRAIPFNKMVETIKEDPFIPIAWQKEHKGMQGSEYFTDDKHISLIQGNWLQARDNAIKIAEGLSGGIYKSTEGVLPPVKVEEGVTKQLCNRLLEPFMWTTMLITGSKSGWENFFNLRCPQYEYGGLTFKSQKDCYNNFLINHPEDLPYLPTTQIEWLKINKGQAEIHIMDLAEKIYDAYNESTPKVLKAGEWHIPFEDKLPTLKVAYTDDGLDYKEKCTTEDKVFMSVAMAARTSYTVVGEEKELNPHALIGLHDRLLAQDPPHSSPLEHCARAMSEVEYTAACSTGLSRKGFDGKAMYGWCNNLKGFVPYRYMVDNEK